MSRQIEPKASPLFFCFSFSFHWINGAIKIVPKIELGNDDVPGIKRVINPIYVADAVSLLKGKDVPVSSVVGFPFGTHSSEIKVQETTEVIERGGRQVDRVIRVGAVKDKKIRM